MKSKTIIISALEDTKKTGRGILTIYQEDDLLKCKLRLYNLEKLSRYCKLAIYHNKEVYSANLIDRNGVYESSFVGDFDIDQDFYAALVNTDNENEILLAGGTYQGFYFNDCSVFTQNDSKEEMELNEFENVEPKDQSCVEDCNKCSKCMYKEFFYSQTRSVQGKQENIEPSKERLNDNVESVIASVLPQFEYIFKNYNPDEELNNLIVNSRFVKIKEKGEQYSIGAIYENDNLKYMCYAVKCNYNEKAPLELGQHYQWLPTDKEDPLSDGYYVVFQDAKDLKILEF